MNAEELCKKVQDTKKAYGDGYFEEEMSSSEYAHRYMGRPGYSVRKHLQLIIDEQKKYRRNY
ncbi:MAG: hypothetical protein IKJ70_02925 [Clostridia bacterium]|nr:hypothetical protein [Clostridia bacterium]MBR3948338.1 hypothetical protein [Clostridia bacterium]